MQQGGGRSLWKGTHQSCCVTPESEEAHDFAKLGNAVCGGELFIGSLNVPLRLTEPKYTLKKVKTCSCSFRDITT